MRDLLLGSSPIPSILGYIVGGLTVLDEMIRSNGVPTDTYGWIQLALGVGLAVLGRSAKQANVTHATAPAQAVVIPPKLAEAPNPVAAVK